MRPQSHPARSTRPGLAQRVAIVGLGRLGTACARAVAGARDLALEAIVMHPESVAAPLPRGLSPSVKRCEAGALSDVDAALLCVPRERILDLATQILSRGIPVVEAGRFHGAGFREHRDAIHRETLRHRRSAVVGAGWDPGMLPLLRGWLALLVPKGHTSARPRPAASLHHTTAARALPALAPGAHTLQDLAASQLFGAQSAASKEVRP